MSFSCGDTLKLLDLYGMKIDMNFQSKPTHKTLCGGIVSFFVIIVILLGAYDYGKELFEKKKPIVVSNERFVRNPQRMDFDKQQQTLMVGIKNPDGTPLRDDSLYKVNARLFIMQKKLNPITKSLDASFVTQPLKMRQCSINDIKVDKLKEFFGKIELSSLVCPDDNQDVYIEGDFSGDFYTRLEIFVEQCRNSTIPGSKVCAPQYVINEKLDYAHFVVYMIDKLVDQSNLQNPFSYEGINLYSMISNKVSKEITAFFENYYVQSDVGIISEDIHINRDFIYTKVTESISFENPDVIVKLVIRPEKNRETVIQRRYLKVSDFVAQIGGLVKLIGIIGFIITFPFVKFHLNKEIVNSIFDFNLEESNQSDVEQISNKIRKKDTQIGQINIEDDKQKITQLLGKKNQEQQAFQLQKRYNFIQKEFNDNILETQRNKQLRLISQGNTQSMNQQINSQSVNSQSIFSNLVYPYSIKNTNRSTLEYEKYNLDSDDQITSQSPNTKSIQTNKIQQDYTILDRQQTTSFLQQILQKVKNIVQPIKRITKFSICEYLAFIFCPITQRSNKKIFLVNKTIKIVKSHLDIQFLLHKFQEIDKLKQIILSDDQMKLFDLLPRPTIKRCKITNQIQINDKSYQNTQTQTERQNNAYQGLINILSKEKISFKDYKVIQLFDSSLIKEIQKSNNISRENILSQPQQTYQQMDQIKNDFEITESSNLKNKINFTQQNQHSCKVKTTAQNDDDDQEIDIINEDIVYKNMNLFLNYKQNSLNI